MKNNNGKIAIAIVAMFVVALSVVGFTYAYFTASVKQNTATKSSEVVAGMMEVQYTQNRTLQGTNIVPGWISDGRHYATTFNDENGNLRSKSVKTSTDENGVAKGAVKPALFSVANTTNSKNDAYYVVTLKTITNGIAEADQVNMTYELTDTTNREVVGRGQLPESTEGENYVVISKLLTKLATDSTPTEYSLVLKYKDTGAEQNASQGQTVKATVKVIGVSTAENGKYYDAVGNEITPATVAADTFGTDNAAVVD